MNPRNAAAPVIFRRSAKPNGYGGWIWTRGDLTLKIWRGERGSFRGAAHYQDEAVIQLRTGYGSAQLAADALRDELEALARLLMGIGDLATNLHRKAG